MNKLWPADYTLVHKDPLAWSIANAASRDEIYESDLVLERLPVSSRGSLEDMACAMLTLCAEEFLDPNQFDSVETGADPDNSDVFVRTRRPANTEQWTVKDAKLVCRAYPAIRGGVQVNEKEYIVHKKDEPDNTFFWRWTDISGCNLMSVHMYGGGALTADIRAVRTIQTIQAFIELAFLCPPEKTGLARAVQSIGRTVLKRPTPGQRLLGELGKPPRRNELGRDL